MIDTKLHCGKCGCQRNMVAGFPFPKEDGTMGVVGIRVKKLKELLKNGQLPNQAGFAFPRKELFGNCPVCFNTTFYEINSKNNIVVVA